MDQKASAKVLVLDFGAQYGQLIARRVRDLNVYSEIVPCDISADEIRDMNASALILSGGPASVYAEDAPSIDPAIFDLGLPVLGFCYGHQITAVTLGGKVGHSEVGEYGRATITRTAGAKLFNSTPMEQTVWMSHRDAVSEVPEGFTVTASTDVCPVAAMECVERKIFTTQFHPEVKHDGAIIVRGDRFVSATCYLPLSDSLELSKDLGTRHRAAVGISEVSDSLTIVVSEETGKVSIAMGGQLYRNVDAEFLRSKLKFLQSSNIEPKRFQLLKRRLRNVKKADKTGDE